MIQRIEIFIILILTVSSVYAIDTRPSDITGPVGIGGNPTGGQGNPGISPVTSDLLIYAEIDCFDTERDNFATQNVVFAQSEWHDDAGSQSTPNYLTYAFHDYAVWAPEPGTILNFDPNNPSYIRFEARDSGDGGGCYAYGSLIHDEYDSGTFVQSFIVDWERAPESILYYTVDWDNTQSNCQLLGGDWLSGGSYDGRRCCGDDWIWVNNLPLNYDASLSIQGRIDRQDANTLCLYSKAPLWGSAILGEDYGMPAGSYFCSKSGMAHAAYDVNLENLELSDTTRGHATYEYYFLGSGDDETDVGVWSDYNDANPMFCYMNFNHQNGQGVGFEWKTIEEVASLGQAECDIYLGYNWTGSQCCGSPGVPDTYNDPEVECKTDQVHARIIGGDLSFISSPAYLPQFAYECNNDIQNRAGYANNRACYEGKPVDNNSFQVDANGNMSIFNENGVMYSCEGGDNPHSLPTVSPCDTKGDIALCTYSNSEWVDLANAPALHGLHDGAYGGFDTAAELIDTVRDSVLPAEVEAATDFDQTRECCYNKGCWDGTQCRWEGVRWALLDDQFAEYNNYEDGMDVYMCKDGTWNGPLEPSYDWYVNTEDPQFCGEDYQCACKDADCVSFSGGGCTNIDGYFTGNYLCEGGDWTSRNKLIATQMMDIAGSSDYTIFCDTIENAVNYFEPLVPAEPNINGVCVLNYNGGTVLGFALNSDGSHSYDIDVDTILFNQNNGIVSRVLDEDLSSCVDGIVGSSGYGSFRRCITGSDKYFYNNQTQLFLYSKNGLSGNPLSWNYNSADTQLIGFFNQVSNHISSNAGTINNHPDIMNIEVFNEARKYDSLYLAKNGGDVVFGTLEELYDDDWNGNRYYLGVLYDSVSGVDCDTIEDADQFSYCGTSGSVVIVIERRLDNEFQYWSDLSAKIRFN